MKIFKIFTQLNIKETAREEVGKILKKRIYCTIRTILREYRALKIFWITQKFVRKISKNSIETHKTQNFGSEFGGGR